MKNTAHVRHLFIMTMKKLPGICLWNVKNIQGKCRDIQESNICLLLCYIPKTTWIDNPSLILPRLDYFKCNKKYGRTVANEEEAGTVSCSLWVCSCSWCLLKEICWQNVMSCSWNIWKKMCWNKSTMFIEMIGSGELYFDMPLFTPTQAGFKGYSLVFHTHDRNCAFACDKLIHIKTSKLY